MADYENKYGSRGATNTAVALGAVGTGLGLFNGGLKGLFGGQGCDGGRGPTVDRFELMESQKISTLESQNAMLRAEIDTQRRFGIVETQVAHLHDTVDCLRGELARTNERLDKITTTVIPSSLVWTAPATP